MALGLHSKFQNKALSKQQKLIDSLAYIGGIMIPVMTLPQLWKIIETQSAQSLSLISWVSYLIGVILWLIYGISRKQRVIIVTYGLSVIIYSLVVIAILVFQ